MGSSKKHKSKESRKRKHHSRSSSEELNEKEKHRHHRHHKKHKERKKEKQYTPKSEDSYDSDDDVVLVPPPPRISCPPTPPPPILVPPPPKISSSSPPPVSSSSDQSLSIEETNKLRAKLGLKPLEVPSATPVKKDDGSPVKVMGGIDMGDFIHKPADNIASKQRAEKIKAKIAERKEKRQLEAKLASMKKLAEDSDDDDDTLAWVKKNRKLTEERLKAEKKAKELDDMDAVFGVGDLVEDDLRMSRKAAYTTRDLKGLRVEHDMDRFGEGKEVVLTLKDKGVLDEEDDTLVNVNMIDEERYKKNIERRKQKPHLYGYDALEESMDDDDSTEPKILTKYDEEIEGEKRSSFILGVDESRKKEMVRKKLHENKRLESLDLPKLQIASDYFTEEEISLKFKKPKKKVRKIRDRKTKTLKADDLVADSTGSEDWLKDLGTRRQTNINFKPDPDTDEVSDIVVPATLIKKEPEDDLMDIDDLPPPPENFDDIKLEQDDSELELALKKARKLKQKETLETKPTVDKVAEMIIKTESPAYQAPGPGGSIVLNATAEFCRTLGDIPTYGLSGNREEDAQELLDFEREMKEDKRYEEITMNRGGWNDVEMDDKPVDIVPYEAPILDEEPNLGSGVAGALRLAVSKGYLEKETTKRPSASRFAHLQAQNYSIEDKTHTEDDKFGRRERYCGPTSDFKEKESYKPNVKLDYIDDNGHVLTAKEAFRYLSHKFHGKGPGKNKVEKRMKKGEQEVLMKQMSSTDTPLGTLNMLQQKQKETQSPYVVLSGNKQLQAASAISKTKL